MNHSAAPKHQALIESASKCSSSAEACTSSLRANARRWRQVPAGLRRLVQGGGSRMQRPVFPGLTGCSRFGEVRQTHSRDLHDLRGRVSKASPASALREVWRRLCSLREGMQQSGISLSPRVDRISGGTIPASYELGMRAVTLPKRQVVHLENESDPERFLLFSPRAKAPFERPLHHSMSEVNKGAHADSKVVLMVV